MLQLTTHPPLRGPPSLAREGFTQKSLHQKVNAVARLFFRFLLAFCVFMCYNKNKVVLYMKKYSWLALIVFTLALIVCIVAVSKNEAVRDTFMKAAQDLPYFKEQCVISFKNSLFGRI